MNVALPTRDAWRAAALVTWAVGVQVAELIATVGMVAFVLAALVDVKALWHRRPPAAAVYATFWPLLAFLGWALVAPACAGRWPSGTGLARTLDWATVPLVALAAARLSPGAWRTLAQAAAVTLAVSAAVAGAQHFGVWPSWERLGSSPFVPASWRRVYEVLPGDGARFMGGGLLFHRLKFAHVSSLVVVGLVVAALRLHGRPRVLCGVAALVGVAAVWWFPAARMAAVALSVGVVATVALLLGSWRKALAAGLLLAGVAAAVFLTQPALRGRFVSAFTSSGSGERHQHLASGWRAVQTHPLAGVGLGRFRPATFATPDMPQHVRDNPGKAHNQLLSVAAETGLVGAALFALALAALLRAARGAAARALAGGGLTVFVLLSLAHDPLFQAPFSMALVLLLGLALGASWGRRSETSPRASPVGGAAAV